MGFNKVIELFISFFKIGLTAFGGPAMIAYIKELAVDKKQWIDEKTFHEGVALAQAIPGATVMQVAAFVGFKTRGILGGIASFVGFGLPAFILMGIFSALYIKTKTLPEILSIFTGLQVIVVAIVANAALSFAKPILKSKGELLIGLVAFIFFMLRVNPFFIIIFCSVFSQIIFRDKTLNEKKSVKKDSFKELAILFVFLVIFLFLLVLFDKTLFSLALVMMKIDIFAFGGGYASLPLMLHEFVDRLRWLDAKTFMDGIALGQVTPGPIVITATFVGYLLKGFIGAIVATVAVFSPSFLIMALASEIGNKIKNSKTFIRAKKGIFSSFSGLLLFAMIKFIEEVDWNIIKVLLVFTCFIALLRKVSIFYVVILGAVFSVLFFY
ncbi:chromate efflux transporter [Thermodesulfovibrio yellowstonii]|uniref:Transporter n=1 Tax=Thermodesulfovibrio yellowstonii TaxID=28262 RepID=A0A9W6GCP9_9BACT|nr:chromate efflux transporter [Thermodesulfovibrio islandicus]GLI52763.1 transporter [Thermodesulfovibrio islandicus]